MIVFDPYQNFTQSPKFSIPRPYMEGIEIGNTWTSIVMVDNVITLTGFAGFTYRNIFVIRPNVMTWTSNNYSLDYILEDHWGDLPPDPTHLPFYVTTEYIGADADFPGRVILRLPGSDTQRAFFPLPPSPSSYWMNRG